MVVIASVIGVRPGGPPQTLCTKYSGRRIAPVVCKRSIVGLFTRIKSVGSPAPTLHLQCKCLRCLNRFVANRRFHKLHRTTQQFYETMSDWFRDYIWDLLRHQDAQMRTEHYSTATLQQRLQAAAGWHEFENHH